MTKRRTAPALRERKAAPTACAARFAPRRAQTSPFAGKPNQTQAPQPPINRMNKFALRPIPIDLDKRFDHLVHQRPALLGAIFTRLHGGEVDQRPFEWAAHTEESPSLPILPV